MNTGSGLCCQVKELEEEVSRLHTIRDDKKEPECPAALREGQEGSMLIRLGNGDFKDAKGWKLTISGRKFSGQLLLFYRIVSVPWWQTGSREFCPAKPLK